VTSSVHNLNVQQVLREEEEPDDNHLKSSASEPIQRKRTKEEREARRKEEALRKEEAAFRREEENRHMRAKEEDAELEVYMPYLSKVLEALDELISVPNPTFQKKLRVAVEEKLEQIKRKPGNRASVP
jgi:hypothetical protein